MFLRRSALIASTLLAVSPLLSAADPMDAASAIGDPTLETPTLRSLGLHWAVSGDRNANATVSVAWRSAGGAWKPAALLWRVEHGAQKEAKGGGSLDIPDDASLFAGSILLLDPGAEYELKVALSDPDGGNREVLLKARTETEPSAPANAEVFHVAPGSGGGRGTANDPFLGVAAAQAQAHPGAVFLLHAGTYPPFQIAKSGEPGRPIVWRAAGDGEPAIDGTGAAEGRIISADNTHDVWFEGLTIRNGGKGIVANGCARLVVRGCHIHGVEYGIVATRNDKDTLRSLFIADNLIEGPSTWPRSKGIEDARGIQVTGEGHAICFNRIRGFADAVDTFPSRRCADIDIYGNEISEMTDDGAELDYSERNVRCFLNRFTNVFQGISVQPVHGGPVYAFRNVLYNVVAEPFKMHSNPSGALFFHNTVVKKGMPLFIYTNQPVRRCWTRNNLFIGTGGAFAFETTAKMRDCDFDYDGIGGGPWTQFLKWNGERYKSYDEAVQKAPAWRHAIRVDAASAFAGGALPPADETVAQPPADLRLKAGGQAVDAGAVLPGFNDGFAGKAPDLGAYELGAPLPHYGPRTAKSQ